MAEKTKTVKQVFKKGQQVLFPDTSGSLIKGTILSFIRTKGIAKIECEETGDTFKCPIKLLEEGVRDVNWRFNYYEDLARLTILKEFKSIFVAGTGGLGKTYTVRQILESEEFIEDQDYVYIKGHVSAYALYKTLEEYSHLPIIFDDADGILRDPIAINILKAVMDSYSVRKVKWFTSQGVKTRISNSFVFTGSIIFLSNLPMDKIPQPVTSRTIMVDVSMTNEEKMDRMRYIITTMPEMDDFEEETKEELLHVLNRYKGLVHDFNLRSLVKAATMYEKTGNWDYVKAAILAS